ncbi:DUF2510 domain-containing protein [Leifsonia sp. 22587]|uniref:DUF2510 domain-containing protein n=1 Tax=Leifsonia sp. 22587 TaxID=3453946 RepID=UPI003F871F1C
MTNTTPPPPTTPAGWYDDGQGRLRWWDGQSWADVYAPVVQQVMVSQPQTSINGVSVTGFVLACVAFPAAAVSGMLGALLALFGLMISIGGYADKNHRGRGFAVAGMIISAAAICLGALMIFRYFTLGS